MRIFYLLHLVESKHLKDLNYSIIHYDSPDERGIDVALLYNEEIFKVAHSETFTVELEDEDGDADYTRDILLVSGLFNGTELHVIVNHWPSRRSGDFETAPKRLKASKKACEAIDKVRAQNPEAKIIVMGDFNDDPFDDSVKHEIFDADFLKLYDGKYKGSPYRTYVGKKYKGGYSDHFPVYVTVKKK